jgi:putative ABC transport system permease protein
LYFGAAPEIGIENATFSVPQIHDIGANLKTISKLGTFCEIGFTIVGLVTTGEIPAGVVVGNYFEVMGLRPAAGPGRRRAAGAIVLT